jgi:sec-independent protein translocase protein TatA
MFSNIGFSELLVIAAIFLLLFGARRLPEIGASLGKGIREFKRSISEAGDASLPHDDRAPGGTRQIDAPPSQPTSGGDPKRLSQ